MAGTDPNVGRFNLPERCPLQPRAKAMCLVDDHSLGAAILENGATWGHDSDDDDHDIDDIDDVNVQDDAINDDIAPHREQLLQPFTRLVHVQFHDYVGFGYTFMF